MKKVLCCILSIILSVYAITFSETIGATEISDYTIKDLENLQNFLLCKETSDLSGKNYDLDGDGTWSVFDLCIMKQQVFKENKILIAYFTRSENVIIENPENIDTDATSSASLLPKGNSAVMANHIQAVTGGDLFSIVTENPYPADYEDCLKRITQEQAENVRPVLKNHVDNISDYDTVFLGFPNWAYTCPMVVFSFLEEYDFSGKTIIPFCTHGTGGLAGTIDDIRKTLPADCKILQPVGVYREDIPDCYDTIKSWLSELGF